MSNIKFKNHKGEEFLFVKLPKDATNIEVNNCIKTISWDNPETGSYDDYLGLPYYKYKLIAPLSEMTEELWEGVVKNPFVVKNFFNPKEVSFSWWDYNDDFWSSEIKSATESGESLLKSLQIYMVNPFEKPTENSFDFISHNYESALKEWQQAEENAGNWVLIQKI
jgi:hypothetical protein